MYSKLDYVLQNNQESEKKTILKSRTDGEIDYLKKRNKKNVSTTED